MHPVPRFYVLLLRCLCYDSQNRLKAEIFFTHAEPAMDVEREEDGG